MKKLEILFQDQQNMLNRCVHCSALFTERQREWQICEKAQIGVGTHGEMQAPHVIDRGFELNKFVLSLRAQKISWQNLFWKLYSCMVDFFCTQCEQRFTGNRLNHCSHTCCLSVTHRADADDCAQGGCQTRCHKIEEEVDSDLIEVRQKAKVSPRRP